MVLTYNEARRWNEKLLDQFAQYADHRAKPIRCGCLATRNCRGGAGSARICTWSMNVRSETSTFLVATCRELVPCAVGAMEVSGRPGPRSLADCAVHPLVSLVSMHGGAELDVQILRRDCWSDFLRLLITAVNFRTLGAGGQGGLRHVAHAWMQLPCTFAACSVCIVP